MWDLGHVIARRVRRFRRGRVPDKEESEVIRRDEDEHKDEHRPPRRREVPGREGVRSGGWVVGEGGAPRPRCPRRVPIVCPRRVLVAHRKSGKRCDEYRSPASSWYLWREGARGGGREGRTRAGRRHSLVMVPPYETRERERRHRRPEQREHEGPPEGRREPRVPAPGRRARGCARRRTGGL